MAALPETDLSEAEARLRDMSLSWPDGYALARSCALDAVIELRTVFNEFAGSNPYEAEKVESWDLSAKAVQNEPVVEAMARTFSLLLNRRGLLKIDPTPPLKFSPLR